MRSAALFLAFCGTLLLTHGASAQQAKPRVLFQTSMGEITVELEPERAPLTVANFLEYVGAGHFDGTIIYRVQPGFVLQAGSYEANGNKRPTRDPIPLEANNGLSNARGSISMARGEEPNTATAEFFINLADNPALDRNIFDLENRTGYAVFGTVVGGMEIVDAIAMVPRGDNGPFPGAAPVTPIVITRAAIIDAAAPSPAPPAP